MKSPIYKFEILNKTTNVMISTKIFLIEQGIMSYHVHKILYHITNVLKKTMFGSYPQRENNIVHINWKNENCYAMMKKVEILKKLQEMTSGLAYFLLIFVPK